MTQRLSACESCCECCSDSSQAARVGAKTAGLRCSPGTTFTKRDRAVRYGWALVIRPWANTSIVYSWPTLRRRKDNNKRHVWQTPSEVMVRCDTIVRQREYHNQIAYALSLQDLMKIVTRASWIVAPEG